MNRWFLARGAQHSRVLFATSTLGCCRARWLNVANLSKEYPTPRGALAVLSDVSFSLAPGDAAAIMGPSGSGKSSLLYVLGALEPPTSGTVTLDGRDPFQLPAAQLAAFRNESVGFVFQDHCLLPQCTVLENVLIPTLVASGRDGCRPRHRARAPARRTGRPRRPHRSSSRRAVGRRAAARRDRARARAQPAAAPVRRADRQPRSRLRGTASRRCCSTFTASNRAS